VKCASNADIGSNARREWDLFQDELLAPFRARFAEIRPFWK